MKVEWWEGTFMILRVPAGVQYFRIWWIGRCTMKMVWVVRIFTPLGGWTIKSWTFPGVTTLNMEGDCGCLHTDSVPVWTALGNMLRTSLAIPESMEATGRV